MSSPDPKTEVLDLCDRLLDGEFTAEDRARLEQLVLGDTDLRRLYVETMHLHASLRQNASRIGDRPLEDVLVALPEEPAIRARRCFPRWPLQFAAALAVGFAIWWFVPHRGGEPLARLTETNGARWNNSSLPTNPGASLGAGRLRLAEGVARLVFRSGAEVSLEGPAELELTGPNACFLHGGALVAHVPEQAHGFLVATKNARLIDHGTDFGITADAAGRGQVEVLKGDVELQHDHSGQTLRLQTRESASITGDRFGRADHLEVEPDRFAFARSTPRAERRSMVTITTAGGTGDAAYVVSPKSTLHFSDTLLLVKNGPGKSYLRKAFLRFDLAPLRDRHVSDASLTLNFDATGFGYASLTSECTFAVYGLKDDALDDWSADAITWENAPAFSPNGGDVDSSKAIKLGSFTTPRGVVSGAFSIEGPALAEFLNQDANRRATLIVVRETMVPDVDAAVHGFAGNHHPTLPPPTLRLSVADGR